MYDKAVDDFMKKYEQLAKRDSEMLAKLHAGQIDNAEYAKWRIKVNLQLQGSVKKMAKILDDADIQSIRFANGALDRKYATAFYKELYNIEKSLNLSIDFELKNPEAIHRAVSMRYYRKPTTTKIDRINRRRISSVITSAVAQGKSVQEVARSFKTAFNMNRNSAIRNARTWINSVHNGGEYDAAKTAEDCGIMMTKRWIATIDNKTRDSHVLLDGEVVGVDEKFSNGGMFPCDPELEPEEYYNCRCTCIYEPKGFSANLKARHMDIGDMSYEEWKESRR